MNIIIFGAAGDVGQHIVDEASKRAHGVTGVVRDETQYGRLPADIRHCAADVSDSRQVSRALQGHDVAISAIRPPAGRESELPLLTHTLANGAARAGVRLLLVGGAARLLIPGRDGETVLTAPDFLPTSAVAIVQACQAQYELLLQEKAADWTYLSPAAMLQTGPRTGHYRLGRDHLVVDEQGRSHISLADFAVAMLDEVESARHTGSAFTVGY